METPFAWRHKITRRQFMEHDTASRKSEEASEASRRRMVRFALAFGAGAWLLLMIVVAMSFMRPQPTVASEESRAAAIRAGGPPPEIDLCLRSALGDQYFSEVQDGTMDPKRFVLAMTECFGSPEVR